MGRKDIVTKDYMNDSEVFADAFNFLIYGGRQVIMPARLHPMDMVQTVIPYGTKGAGRPRQKYRDGLKYSKDAEKLNKLLQEDDKFQNLERKAANTIKECAGVEIDIKDEERVNMCKAIKDMQEKKYEEGKKAGEQQGISQGVLMTLYGLVKDGILRVEEAAVRAEMSVTEFNEKCKELLLS